ncbi:Protein lsb5 [Neolecta irregularis DAH-3]|uniref:Protein lsb5 n=1 Tax=Neolecta irregularis (strain DAH-3) TaxID=1198029 RepID=A0A1U7LW97_NEOID|nr:Protein lsb5 [Neolecta irregularis DAH-3]|eukprot:OLL26899.1 Protein lsb5 [Neolecta irregularis DAH-3]
MRLFAEDKVINGIDVAYPLISSRIRQSQTGSVFFAPPHLTIVRLAGDNYSEDDLSDIFELSEVVFLQDSGPREAARALRKRLKHGNLHNQLRALTVMQNGDRRFQQQFADESLIERLRIIISDPLTGERVKKKLTTLILSWREYGNGLGALYSHIPHPRNRDEPRSHPPPRPPKPRSAPQSPQPSEAKPRNTLKKEKPKNGKLLSEKSKNHILSTIAAANQASTQLSNALESVNRDIIPIAQEPTVLARVSDARKSRKEIIRLIQIVETEDFIGTLIHANEELVSALQLFEVMKTQVDDDSDSDAYERDEELEERIRRRIEAIRSEKPPEMPPRPPSSDTELKNVNGKKQKIPSDISLSSLVIGERRSLNDNDDPFKTPVSEDQEITWHEFAREEKA